MARADHRAQLDAAIVILERLDQRGAMLEQIVLQVDARKQCGPLAKIAGSPLTIAALVAPMCLIALGVGLCAPMNVALALHFDRARIGVAFSLFYAVQSLMSALASSWVAIAHPVYLLGLALIMSACNGAPICLLLRPARRNAVLPH